MPTKLAKSIMKSYHLRIPKYDLPLRFRPVSFDISASQGFADCCRCKWFLLFTCIIMTILALLGFTNFSRALPINDKFLHFLCFSIATAVFYFIVDVEECVINVTGLSHLSNSFIQELKKDMVLETLCFDLYNIHMSLLWWNSQRIRSSYSTC